MPEKDGAEEKSTKSVVNKKQKQMMGEEGYDIARDMGRVRPSKDKKDATTMPPSKEMEKTRKVYKGPSALDIVKKKYGKAVMKVGKKKANEELDLTQVAEAFGGYIVEANGKNNNKDKGPNNPEYQKLLNQQRRRQQAYDAADDSDSGSPIPDSKQKEPPEIKKDARPFTSRQRKEVGTILKNIGKDPKKAAEKALTGATKPSKSEIERQKRRVSALERQATAPKPGEREASAKIVTDVMTKEKQKPQAERDLPPKVDTSFLDPQTDPFETVPDREKRFKGDRGVSVKSKIDKASRAADTLMDRIQTGRTKTGADAEKVAKGKPKPSRKRRSDAKSLEQLKKEIDARNPTYKSPKTGGELPIGGADDRERKQQKAYQSGIEAAARGTQTGNIPVDPYKILPSGKKKVIGTPQKDRPTEQPTEKPVTGVYTGQGTGRKDVIGKTKNQETGNRRSTTQDQQKLNTAQTGVKPDGTYASPEERKKLFQQSKGESETMKNVKKNLTKGPLARTGGALAKKTDTHTPVDVATKVEPSLVSKAAEVINKNPVASLIAYDIGKGILGKIMKARIPPVRGGRAIQVSAGQ